jgi:hypothetical protein
MQTATTSKLPALIYYPYHYISKIKIHWLFILLFAQTGVAKLANLPTFQFALWKAELLRHYYVPLSYIIPISELVIAVLLCFDKMKIGKRIIPLRLIGMYASLLLMLSFTVYLAYSLAFEKNLPCVCGGIVSWMNWSQHLVFNIIFSALALRGIILQHNNRTS